MDGRVREEIAALRVQERDGYGRYVAGLAVPYGWRLFWTLTHEDRAGMRGVDALWTRAGIAEHRRRLRVWFHQEVRAADPRAAWWSETEFTKDGRPHEHGMMSMRPGAPWLAWRTAWWHLAGYAKVIHIDERGAVSPAAYVAKYAGKGTAQPPTFWGIPRLGTWEPGEEAYG